MSQGKWQNTYAATNSREYWAVGVQGMILFQVEDNFPGHQQILNFYNFFFSHSHHYELRQITKSIFQRRGKRSRAW